MRNRGWWVGLLLWCACTGGRDKLIAQLQSTRPDERAVAIKKLAELGNADDLVLFTQAARDPASIVRAEAIEALGASQDVRVVDLLGELMGDADDQVQARAAFALARIKSDKARAYLKLQYGRRGRDTRLAIVEALKAANVPGAMAEVIKSEAEGTWDRNSRALVEGSLPERVGAAEELGKSGRPEVVLQLLKLLRDGQVVLAAAAVRGLGTAQDKRAVAPIAELLKENFPELREAACDALAQLKDPAALGPLAEVALERTPLSPLATAALLAIPPSPEVNKALCEVAQAGGGSEVLAAGREMRKRGGCPLEPILEKLKGSSTQLAALSALAALGGAAKEAAPKVAPLLASADASVRKAAADALTELGDPSVAAAVQKAWEAELKLVEPVRADWIPKELPHTYGKGFDPDAPIEDDDPEAKLKVRQSELFRKVRLLRDDKLKELNRAIVEPQPPRELVDDFNEDQVKVLASLLRALARLGSPDALTVAEPYLRESSPSLRASACVALAWLGPQGLEAARPCLTDPERAVQGAAAAAFGEAGSEGQRLLLEAVGSLIGDRTRLLEPLRGVALQASSAPTLVKLVGEQGPEAALAAQLLGELKAPGSLDALLKVLGDRNAVARREVLIAVGHLGGATAIDTVARDLYSESPDARAAACEALGELGAGRHLDALDALKGDYYRRVREAAQAALARLGSGSRAKDQP